jgi:F-type H+-transporting ATPase subunit b
MQLVILLLLLFLLAKFAWKPIMEALTEREEGIQNALDAAEEAKVEMQNLTASNDKLLKEARAERETMLKEARDIKDKMISEAKEEAQTQANAMIAQPQSAIEGEKKSCHGRIKISRRKFIFRHSRKSSTSRIIKQRQAIRIS